MSLAEPGALLVSPIVSHLIAGSAIALLDRGEHLTVGPDPVDT
jgi:hypothetical protein